MPDRCTVGTVLGRKSKWLDGTDVWAVTGTTQTNVFASQTMWQGREFTPISASTPTVPHDRTNIFLQGAVNLVTAAGNTLTLRCHNNAAYEVGRKT